MTTSQEILDESYPIIDRLAKSRSINGSFAYYESEDVSQEIWFMCLEAMKNYDSERGPIENFLVTHVTNRFKNLMRDKYFRPGSDLSTSGLARVRMNLVNALPLDGGDMAEQGSLLCCTPISIDPIEYLLCEETLAHIRQHLPNRLLEPFEELICNNKVRSSLAKEVQCEIAKILTERDNDVGD